MTVTRPGVGNIQADGRLTESSRLLSKASGVVSSPPPLLLGHQEDIKVYRWRWVVLAILFLNCTVSNFIWIMSATIADLMVCYYGITDTLLNFTTTSYMMVYTVLALPAAWFMDKYGLRLPMVLTSATISLGATIRVIGTGTHIE